MRIKITDEMLTTAVKSSVSFCEVIRKLGLKEAGGTHSHYTRRVAKIGISTDHFTGQNYAKGKPSPKRKVANTILVLRNNGGRAKSAQLTRALVEIGVKHECSKCGQGTTWLGNKLTLDVDHINENWLDDRRENLRFLCPNCHSQFSRKLIGDVM